MLDKKLLSLCFGGGAILGLLQLIYPLIGQGIWSVGLGCCIGVTITVGIGLYLLLHKINRV